MSSESASTPQAGGSLADRVTNPTNASQTTGTEPRPYRRLSTLPRRRHPHTLPASVT